MKPLCIDLFTGLGGWAEGFKAEGYSVIGFDIDPRFAKDSPCDEFVLADVRNLDGRRFKDARVIVASPPCNEFSSLRRGVNPLGREPDMTCVEAVWRIRDDAGVPTILENVCGAQRFLGPAAHRGSRYLWGDIGLLPTMPLENKVGAVAKVWKPTIDNGKRLVSPKWRSRDRSPTGAALRAKIPVPLARAVARAFLPDSTPQGNNVATPIPYATPPSQGQTGG